MKLSVLKKNKKMNLENSTYSNLNELKRVFDGLPDAQKQKIATMALQKYEKDKANLENFNSRNSDEKIKKSWKLKISSSLLFAAAWIGYFAALAATIAFVPEGTELKEHLGFAMVMALIPLGSVSGAIILAGIEGQSVFNDYTFYIDKHPFKLRRSEKLLSNYKNSKEVVDYLGNKGYMESEPTK